MKRLVIAQGDNKPVYRVANRFTAQMRVHLTPTDPARSEYDAPGIRLDVNPNGTWTVTTVTGWESGRQETVVASGNLSDLPGAEACRPAPVEGT